LAREPVWNAERKQAQSSQAFSYRGYGPAPSAKIIIALTAMLTVRRVPSSTARRMDFLDIQSAKRGAPFRNNNLRTHD
jgi:hypothetical protein